MPRHYTKIHYVLCNNDSCDIPEDAHHTRKNTHARKWGLKGGRAFAQGGCIFEDLQYYINMFSLTIHLIGNRNSVLVMVSVMKVKVNLVVMLLCTCVLACSDVFFLDCQMESEDIADAAPIPSPFM